MQIAITFDPVNDNVTEVVEAVEQVFFAFDTATIEPEAAPLVIPAGAPANATPAPQAAAAALVPAAPVAVQRDAEGLPFDARIHAEPAKLGANGKWSAKRKLDAAFVAQVKAELLGGAQVVTGAVTSAGNAGILVGGTSTAAPAPVSGGFAAPGFTAPAPVQLTGYQELVKLAGQHLQTPENPGGRVTKEWLSAGLLSMGVPNGQLEAVAALPDEQARQIVAAMRSALGV